MTIFLLLLVGLCFVLDGDDDLCLFLFPVDMIHFGESSEFLSFGIFSRNFALVVNSIIFIIDNWRGGSEGQKSCQTISFTS